jgi:hypothetical protein
MADERWQELKRLLADQVRDYVGRVEYGNLRVEVYDGEGVGDSDTARIAMAFESPGGSTNQFAVSYEHGEFHMLDASADQVLRLTEPGAVVAAVEQQIASIPSYRMQRLVTDIDQMLANGSSRQEVFDELNRLLRLGHEFRGGSLTIDELTEACRYTVQRVASDSGNGADGRREG